MSLDARRRQPAKSPSGNSKVQQSPAAGSERVSAIVARHTPGQYVGDPRATRMPKFLEMPSMTLHEILMKADQARLAFGSLPSRLKGKFQNNPVLMLQWIEQPENRQEALKLGLVVPTPEEAHKLAGDAARARRGEQIDIIREAHRIEEAVVSDPEAQPSYGKKGGPSK